MATEVVVFRKWINTGTTIALFPELPADIHDRYCRNSPTSLGRLGCQSMRSSRQSEAFSKLSSGRETPARTPVMRTTSMWLVTRLGFWEEMGCYT